MRTERVVAGLVAAALAAVFGCAHEASDDGVSGGFGGDGTGNTGNTGNAGGFAGAPGGGAGGRPPEREDENQYLAPVVTGRYLWTANPLSGRVALIDAVTLAVTLETAGDRPTEVLGLPDRGAGFGALVLNERSDDATLFRLDAAGRPAKRAPLRTHATANAWASSPSGGYAVAWADSARLDRVPDVLETFQDVTLFSLADGAETATPLSVGRRPSAFVFSSDERFAYAVTEEGINVIALGDEPEVTALVAVSDSPLEDPSTRDVTFAPDGSYAVVRGEGRSAVEIVALPAGDRETVELDAVVTDVDLSPDGERAFAVLGEAASLVAIPLPVAGADPASFPRVALGSDEFGAVALNADATTAVVYSTVTGTTRVRLVDTSGAAGALPDRSYELVSPVTAVFAAPDPRFAVAFQSAPAGSRKAGAFSLLALQAERVPKIVATDASPSRIAFAPDGGAALVAVENAEQSLFGTYVIELERQQVDFIALASPPLSAGVIEEADRAFVAQAHPEGRITFISLGDGSVQTVTGFELSARIVSR